MKMSNILTTMMITAMCMVSGSSDSAASQRSRFIVGVSNVARQGSGMLSNTAAGAKSLTTRAASSALEMVKNAAGIVDNDSFAGIKKQVDAKESKQDLESLLRGLYEYGLDSGETNPFAFKAAAVLYNELAQDGLEIAKKVAKGEIGKNDYSEVLALKQYNLYSTKAVNNIKSVFASEESFNRALASIIGNPSVRVPDTNA